MMDGLLQGYILLEDGTKVETKDKNQFGSKAWAFHEIDQATKILKELTNSSDDDIHDNQVIKKFKGTNLIYKIVRRGDSKFYEVAMFEEDGYHIGSF